VLLLGLLVQHSQHVGEVLVVVRNQGCRADAPCGSARTAGSLRWVK